MNNNISEWVKYSAFGFQIFITILVFYYLGEWIGSKVNFQSLGSIVGIFFGLFASMYIIFKNIKRN